MNKDNISKLDDHRIFIKKSLINYNDQIIFIDRYFTGIQIRSIGVVVKYRASLLTDFFPWLRKEKWGCELEYSSAVSINSLNYIAWCDSKEEAFRVMKQYSKAYSDAPRS